MGEILYKTVVAFGLLLLFTLPAGLVADDQKDEGDQQDCHGQCAGISKQCDSHCSSSVDANLCRDTCDSVFGDAKGYCQGGCQDKDFLNPCDDPQDGFETSEDDCVYSCENHYSDCVMACRAKSEMNPSATRACYKNCSVVFAEEDGLCKFQCATDFDFMVGCPEE